MKRSRQPGGPGRLQVGARAARLRRDRGGLAAEEHDAGSGEERDPKEDGQGDEGTREGQEGGRTHPNPPFSVSPVYK